MLNLKKTAIALSAGIAVVGLGASVAATPASADNWNNHQAQTMLTEQHHDRNWHQYNGRWRRWNGSSWEYRGGSSFDPRNYNQSSYNSPYWHHPDVSNGQQYQFHRQNGNHYGWNNPNNPHYNGNWNRDNGNNHHDNNQNHGSDQHRDNDNH